MSVDMLITYVYNFISNADSLFRVYLKLNAFASI